MSRQDFIHFHCNACGENFEGAPQRVEDVPDQEWHPHCYFATCQVCEREAKQAAWERGLWKAWKHATGPKTADGKAASARNLEGNNQPEQIARSRFNAMKHGVFAKTATYYPAKPGKYPHCASCEHFNNGCDEQLRPGKRNPPACLKRIELFMDFHIAFDTRDPAMLTKYHANMQAMVFQLVNDMILAIVRDGVSLQVPEWHFDKDGGLHYVTYPDASGEQRHVMQTNAHPLLKILIEFMNRNGMALPDSGMTMKVKDDTEQLQGYLQADTDRSESALAYKERQTKALEGLAALIHRGRERQAKDPVLLEHHASETPEP